jgi:hypothetical protein
MSTRESHSDHAMDGSRDTPGQEMARVEWADLWSRHGALYFAEEYAQKPGYDRVGPCGPELRRELDRYAELRQERRLPHTGPLFRYLGNPRPLDAAVVREIISIAEELARPQCVKDGNDPEDVFYDGVRPLHDLRTTVANRWADMGWENNNAAWPGTWSTKIAVGNAADAVYKQLNPHLVLALAEGLTHGEALSMTGVADEAQKQARLEVPF